MELKKEIFREYDIRGIYGEELDEDTAYNIGRAFGTKLIRMGKKETVLAHDNRVSSPILSEYMIKGLISTGVNVIDLGLATTPMCYYGANRYGCNASMMITASHNPKEYNGFKFSYNGIHNAYGESTLEIYELIKKQDFVIGNGSVRKEDISEDYINLVINKLDFGKKKIKVLYDCGNGTTSIIARRIFDRLEIDSTAMFDESDGTFPNHHPDPCIADNLKLLREKVLESHADVGIGYDGDGDRVGFIDDKGNFIDIDKFLIIMWRYLYDKVDNKVCLFDVKCSKSLEDELIKLGVKPLEYRTGNSYTRMATAKYNVPLGGELSGHVYFRDKWPGYDDGIYVGMRLMELLTNIDKPLSRMLDGINKYYATPEIKVAVDDEKKFLIVNNILEYVKDKQYNYITLDGVKVKYDDGFALVRASNTGPNITMRFEAKTEERLMELKEEFTKELNKYI